MAHSATLSRHFYFSFFFAQKPGTVNLMGDAMLSPDAVKSRHLSHIATLKSYIFSWGKIISYYMYLSRSGDMMMGLVH